MNLLLIFLQKQADLAPEIPVGVFWSIITLLIGVIVWVAIRYIAKLDSLLERLDTAVDEIKTTLKIQAERLDNQQKQIYRLEESNRVEANKRRRQ